MTYSPANIVISECIDPVTGLPAVSIGPVVRTSELITINDTSVSP
jgi:hypothetical protein